MSEDDRFWALTDALVASNEVVIDRPKGSHHPRYPAVVCPLDYGYLADTRAMGVGGVDVWRGTLLGPWVKAVVAIVDRHRRDAEVKPLRDCTQEEAGVALATHRTVY